MMTNWKNGAVLGTVAAILVAEVGFAAGTRFTTDAAIVAAPGAINLSGVAASTGTSRAFAPADHVHSITGALPAANVSKDATLAGTTTLGLNLANSNTWTGIETFTATASQGNPILTPQTTAPTAPSNGAMYVSGATTAMSLGVALNGAKQAVATLGAVGSGATQTKRVTGCTTAASALATCNTTVTWTTSFPDASYTVSCWGSGGSGIPALTSGATQIAASVVITTVALSAAAAQYGTLNCIAVHD